MSLRPFVLVLFLSACSNFDELGVQARCRVTTCDGGVDGGLDAGAVDAGATDAGAPDAGEDAGFQLEVLWAQAGLSSAEFILRPGFITAAGPSRVAHMRELVQLVDGEEIFPDAGAFFPFGSILGDIVLLELDTGDFVLEDGGRSSSAAAPALRAYVAGERGAPSALGPFLLVPSRERFVDGGTVLSPDGGPVLFGDVVMTYLLPTLTPGFYPAIAAKGATALGLDDGGFTLSWIPPGPDAGLYSIDDSAFRQNEGLDCPAPLIDVVTTQKTKLGGGPDHRLVQLAECTPDNLSVIAWSRDALPRATMLGPLRDTRGGRLAIGPDSLNQRNPFVAWQAADSLLRLARFNEEGTNGASTRVISREAATARIAAVAVDGRNFPLVVIEAASVGFVQSTADVSAPGSEVILASFTDNLSLRWAAPLRAANKLTVNSAAFVGEALVLDVSCPTGNLQNGDFCRNNRSTWALRVGLADGGFPP